MIYRKYHKQITLYTVALPLHTFSHAPTYKQCKQTIVSIQLAMCDQPLREISNPGASGSLFYLSADDAFIIKTVQKKEARFLQKLLPGYYLVGW